MKMRKFTIVIVLLLTSLILTSCGVSQKQYDAIAEDLVQTQKALQESESALLKCEEGFKSAQQDMALIETLPSYEEKITAAEQEYKEILADFNKVAYHLAYKMVENEWIAGNIDGEEAAAKMRATLVGLGNNELLSLWEAYLVTETEQETIEKGFEYNMAYYRELDELINRAIEKYGILGF